MNYKVYVHIFPNRKKYIGITKQEVEKRWLKGNGYKGNKYMFRAIKKYDSIKDASQENNLCEQNISKVCYGERKTTGGMHWKFYEE